MGFLCLCSGLSVLNSLSSSASLLSFYHSFSSFHLISSSGLLVILIIQWNLLLLSLFFMTFLIVLQIPFPSCYPVSFCLFVIKFWFHHAALVVLSGFLSNCNT
ncbi:hypothetical protein CHARACLAT_022945 [Characodon lateralis]|uniref:NADH dehydrogenase subunit 4L n=1 Tax=Characodon lateralis TaxID=208331 RepID=A0ABU7EPU1_9TELE|nr:hypothetical protein [Characodon lateralis]